jgi:hypothetical protein
MLRKYKHFETQGARLWDESISIHGVTDAKSSKTTGIEMNKFFLPKFDAHSPTESNNACWKFTDLKSYLQEFVNLAHKAGHPVIHLGPNGQRFADLGFTFDGGKWGGTLLQVVLLRAQATGSVRAMSTTATPSSAVL